MSQRDRERLSPPDDERRERDALERREDLERAVDLPRERPQEHRDHALRQVAAATASSRRCRTPNCPAPCSRWSRRARLAPSRATATGGRASSRPALTANTAMNTTTHEPDRFDQRRRRGRRRVALRGLRPITKAAAGGQRDECRAGGVGPPTSTTRPGSRRATPRTILPLKMCAVPSAALPIANCISASLPIDDGQNRMLGTNMTIRK